VIGTLRGNKCEIPPQFVNTRNREVCSDLFGFQEDMTLVSYIPKKGVVLLSTMHCGGNIDPGREKKA
jgi:hypothetical protein